MFASIQILEKNIYLKTLASYPIGFRAKSAHLIGQEAHDVLRILSASI